MAVTKKFIEDRIYINENGCWIWRGNINKRTGYAQSDGKADAHRQSYELWIGPIPHRADLDHAKGCPKHCVNPYTLTPVHRDFNQRLHWRRRTGQMGRRDLRSARWLHQIVTDRLTRGDEWDAS